MAEPIRMDAVYGPRSYPISRRRILHTWWEGNVFHVRIMSP